MSAEEVREARVDAALEAEHPTLFAVHEFAPPRRTPEEVCRERGLNWIAALKLHEDGWLSFDPRRVGRMNPSQEAELIFLGSLVTSGCESYLLRQLLAELEWPYAYRIDRMYYDWPAGSWRILRGDEDVRRAFDQWLEELADSAQLERLTSLRDSVEQAILTLRRSFANATLW